jgi:hypothetical protein
MIDKNRKLIYDKISIQVNFPRKNFPFYICSLHFKISKYKKEKFFLLTVEHIQKGEQRCLRQQSQQEEFN